MDPSLPGKFHRSNQEYISGMNFYKKFILLAFPRAPSKVPATEKALGDLALEALQFLQSHLQCLMDPKDKLPHSSM